MICSKEVVIFVVALIVLTVDGYDESIEISNSSSCLEKYLHIGGELGSGRSNLDFSNFVALSTLKNGGCVEGQTHIRFYFQGRTDFHVLLSSNDVQPHNNDKVFNICEYTFLLVRRNGENYVIPTRSIKT